MNWKSIFFALGELKRGKISEMFEFYLLLSIFTLTERKSTALQVFITKLFCSKLERIENCLISLRLRPILQEIFQLYGL